jgi:hypothetical protein
LTTKKPGTLHVVACSAARTDKFAVATVTITHLRRVRRSP